MLNITLDNGVSLRKLSEMSARGEAVLRTPHVGNSYAAMMLMHELGIPTVIFDRNFGRADTLFHPHFLIRGGKRQLLCSSSVLMTHASVTDDLPGVAKKGELVSDLHTRRLRELYPNAPFELYTDWLRRHADLVLPVLEVVARRQSGLFTRWITSQGYVEDRYGYKPGSHFYGLNGGSSDGWILPNLANVLLSAIIDAVTKGASVSWLLCGHAMAKYLVHSPDKHYEGISDLYDLIRAESGLSLPELLEIRLVEVVPASRFVTTSDRLGQLEELVETYDIHERQNTVDDASLSALEGRGPSAAPAKQARIREIVPLRRARVEGLRKVVHANLHVFRSIEEATHTTQHDLEPGQRLVTTERVLNSTVGALNEVWADLNRLTAHSPR